MILKYTVETVRIFWEGLKCDEHLLDFFSALCPEKGEVADERFEAQVLWRVVEWTEIVKFGKEEPQGKPYYSLPVPEMRVWKSGSWPLLPYK